MGIDKTFRHASPAAAEVLSGDWNAASLEMSHLDTWKFCWGHFVLFDRVHTNLYVFLFPVDSNWRHIIWEKALWNLNHRTIPTTTKTIIGHTKRCLLTEEGKQKEMNQWTLWEIWEILQQLSLCSLLGLHLGCFGKDAFVEQNKQIQVSFFDTAKIDWMNNVCIV